MSYHIYTTDGIILKRSPFGEASVLLYVLTKELGLIMASAQSARLSKSKLRHGLQEYSFVLASFVKGKNGWKLTNVSEKGSLFFDYQKHAHEVLGHIFFILLKTITGELPHPEIFETVRTGFEFLKNLPEEEIKKFEVLLVLRILYELGYVAQSSDTGVFLADLNVWNNELLQKISEKKKVLVEVINKALKESHL